MKLFYAKKSYLDGNPEFTVDLMSVKERKHAVSLLDDGDCLVEFKYGKGPVDGWWCCQIGEGMIDTAPVCGRDNCPYYAPRNGKNGICKDLSPCVVETGKTYGK